MPAPRLEVVSNFDPCDVLESTSARLGFQTSSGETTALVSLFKAVSISVSASSEPASVLDAVLFGGGLCNALDWCPQKQECTTPTREHLALSCHPKHTSKHYIGSATSGTGLVQIWAVETTVLETDPFAAMTLGIVHGGAICSSLQWCPDPAELMKGIPLSFSSIGLLAMALGNGEVHVLPVPQPFEKQAFVKVEPWVQISPSCRSGSLVSCLEWHPSAPHELLLLGTWDGSISLWAMPYKERIEAQQLLQHSVDSLAVRRVVWMKPPSVSHGVSDEMISQCFCTVGHNGHFTVWNRTNMFQPLLDWTMTRWWLMDADVSGDPLSAYIALEDASIRQLPFEMTGFTDQLDQPVFQVYSGLNKGALHAICCSPCNALAAYGGEDGEIAVFVKENVGDARYRKPHVCAGAMKHDPQSGLLHVITASEFRKIGGVYIGGSKFISHQPSVPTFQADTGSAFQHQTIQCLRFSPNGHQTTWLAAGCVSGCVRLIRITE